MAEETTYAIEYCRIDGWWEAGRGWDDPKDAYEDGADHFSQHPKTPWRVRRIEVDSEKSQGTLETDGVTFTSDDSD